jgi:hypothetical protein
MKTTTTTDNPAGPQIDHNRYPKLCRTRSEAELRFTIADCQAALRAMPDNPKAGYYLDEINYCADELARRNRGGRRRRPTVDEIAAAAVRCALDLAD